MIFIPESPLRKVEGCTSMGSTWKNYSCNLAPPTSTQESSAVVCRVETWGEHCCKGCWDDFGRDMTGGTYSSIHLYRILQNSCHPDELLVD